MHTTPQPFIRNAISIFTDVKACVRVLFLFTKADFKTLVFPVTVFAILSAPRISFADLLASMAWTWMHLLQFCVSNQSLDPAEDTANKPWRPIPAGLIDVKKARKLRWALLPVCLIISALAGVPWIGVVLTTAIVANNELGFDRHWFGRNACFSLEYAMFNVGASTIACSLPGYKHDQRIICSLFCNALVSFTTIQAGDFRDVEGDKSIGRRTLPMLYPEASRLVILLCLLGWTSFISIFCGFSIVFAIVYMALGVFLGSRFYMRRGIKDDRTSYSLYFLWFSATQVVHLPWVAGALSNKIIVASQ